jgi:23S rRNA pseudouridine955/2504/2580 synthase
LRSGDIRVNGRKAKPDYAIAAGDELRLWLTDGTAATGRGSVAPGMTDTGEERERAARFAGLILAETKDIVVVNKPRGLLSHGEGGLDTLALAYFAERMQAALAFTPAPLHRLDRNTSGALAVSASMRGAREFSRALREGRVQKRYLALLDGELTQASEWRDALHRDDDALKSRGGGLGDREAHALFEPLAVAQGRTLARIRIYTGLTHQIRAQAALRGHPLSGDLKYGGSSMPGGYVLHSHTLSMPTDLEAESPGAVLAPLPEDALRRLEAIFGINILNRLFE